MKIRTIIGLVLNSVAITASLIGLILAKDAGTIAYAKYFTILTNCFILVAGLISIGYAVEYLLKKDKEIHLSKFSFAVKLITSTSAILTFLTVVCFLQYQPGLIDAKPTSALFWNNILHHYVAPLAFILSFILLDVDRKFNIKFSFCGPALLVTYMCYMVPICLIKPSIIGGAPYVFMDKSVVNPWLMPLFVLGFLVAGLGLSVLLWTLNRIFFLIFTGDEIAQEEILSINEEENKSIVVLKEEIAEVKKIEESGYKGPRIYHISKRDDKMWQVKFANGQKAIKLFSTQAEAIIYAKKLAKNQGGSIRVHSLKGRIRKSN